MYGKSLLAALAVATIALAGVGGLAVAQDENGDESGYGEGMGPGMMQGRGMGQRMGRGMMHGRGAMMGGGMKRCRMMSGMGRRGCLRFIEMADADKDGNVSQEELATFWAQQVEEFEADGDGNLSLEEFATMHAAHSRPMMVDRFQFFDDDGDATVTLSELQAPYARMNRFMGRNDGRGMMRRGMGPRGMQHSMGRGYGRAQQQQAE